MLLPSEPGFEVSLREVVQTDPRQFGVDDNIAVHSRAAVRAHRPTRPCAIPRIAHRRIFGRSVFDRQVGGFQISWCLDPLKPDECSLQCVFPGENGFAVAIDEVVASAEGLRNIGPVEW